MSPLIRTLILWDPGPPLMTSFNLKYFLKAPTSKYRHMGSFGLQHENFGGTQTFSP